MENQIERFSRFYRPAIRKSKRHAMGAMHASSGERGAEMLRAVGGLASNRLHAAEAGARVETTTYMSRL